MKIKLTKLLAAGLWLTLLTGQAQTTFTKITTGPVATDQGIFSSFMWADFNRDGFLDLFVCQWAGDRTNLFYRNNGDGTFTRVTQGDPVQDAVSHLYPAVGDYDNDGYPDLFVTQGRNDPTPKPNALYHNNGDGTFTLADNSGVADVTGRFKLCSALDYDHDGFVDFYALNTDASAVLFHNNGDGTFSRPASALNNPQNCWSVASADYDNDGFMDVFVSGADISSGSYATHFLYHNNRDGTFARILSFPEQNPVTTDRWPIPSGPIIPAWGAAWGDYDNDGMLDLFVTGMAATNRLYHNNGSGNFTNVPAGPMLRPPAGTGYASCAWGDYDNDGYLDLFACSINAPNALFHNNGDGTFAQVLSGAPVEDSNAGIYCHNCGWADYDNDGFLDLFVTRDFGYNQKTTNLLYHNDGNSNAWLEVKLVGTVGNRSAIGAKVRAHATVGGKGFWQLRQITGDGGRSVKPLVAHFGLGDATNVDTLRIQWPSGTVQELSNVAPKQILTITEPPRLLASTTNGIPEFTLKGGRFLQYDILASSNLTAWSSIGALTITNLDGTSEINDTNPPASGEKFYRAVLYSN